MLYVTVERERTISGTRWGEWQRLIGGGSKGYWDVYV
jgi:hypothetical protein